MGMWSYYVTVLAFTELREGVVRQTCGGRQRDMSSRSFMMMVGSSSKSARHNSRNSGIAKY